jgi:hypothetical protein
MLPCSAPEITVVKDLGSYGKYVALITGRFVDFISRKRAMQTM